MERHHNRSHFIHNFSFSRFVHNKYNDLLLADSFRIFALSMISLFIPIFLIKEAGYTVVEVVLMELVMFFGALAAHYFVLKNISAWGVKKAMITSYAFNISLYLSLFYYKVLIDDFGEITFLAIIAFLEILSMAFYWTAHHVYFLSVSSVESDGKKTGVLLAVPTLVSIFGPLLGGILITKFGFRGIFLLSSILLSFASYVLFFTSEIKTKITLDLRKVFDFEKMSKNIIYFIQGCYYVTTGLFWPLFLFFSSIKLISMGFLFFFSNLAYALVVYLGGKNSEKNGCRKLSRIGAIGQSMSLSLRVSVEAINAITAVQTLGGIFGGLLHVNLETGFYKNSHKHHGSAIMNRELYMYLGRITFMLLFLLLLASFSIFEALVAMILSLAFLMLALNLIIRTDRYLMNK